MEKDGKNDQRINEFGENSKPFEICVNGVPKGEEEKKTEEIMVKKLLIW